MLEHLGRFFKNPFATQSSRHPGYKLESVQLEGMLKRIGDAPEERRYPLQMAFYEKLLGSIVLLPVPTGTDIGEGVPLMALENAQGERGVPVFTSEKTLSEWMDHTDEFDGDYVGIPFPVLCGHVLRAKLDFVILNLAGPYGGEIGQAEFSYLAEGLLPPPLGRSGELKVDRDAEMRLSATNSLSEFVSDRLRDVFRHNEALIQHAYVFEVAFGNESLKPGIAIRMIEGSEHEWEISLWPNIQAVLQEMLDVREYANVFLLNTSGDLEDTLKGMMHPFYTRPREYPDQRKSAKQP